jgi:uncharacterized membrane protein YoaK (UPF0700 family)
MHLFDRPRQILAICAAALAGFVDSVGFLAAEGYFVSFMSGNTTRLAVDIAQNPKQAMMPALLICGFVSGVALGAILAAKAGIWRKPVVLGTVATLLMLAAGMRMGGQAGMALAPIVLAMGALNNTFQRNGEVAVGLTYMTGALVRLGQGLAALVTGTAQGAGWLAYLALWMGLAGGAVLGALIYLRQPDLPLWLAAIFAAILAAAATPIARDGQQI